MTEISSPDAGTAGEERRTSPLELLWDLVFVFAVTQVTALLAHDRSWGGFGRSMLIPALIWWAWSAFVWATNAQAASSLAMRACLLLAMLFILIAGLAVPGAFLRDGTCLPARTRWFASCTSRSMWTRAGKGARPARRSRGLP
ncbi:MAG: hypothetical protein DLM64_12095 [Solirubrobacterales bacterium]|nr:MAG: hypothetical protein DLM64_12095 [Solirubrobacterales bacterium]